MVKFRIVDVALLAATIAGAVVAVGSARKLHGLQAERARLSRTAGDLVVSDPGQVHVQALDTGDPLHFAWRVYAPGGQLSTSEYTGGHHRGGSTTQDVQPREFVARIRFTEGSEQTTVYSSFHGAASRWSFGSAEMLRFLIDHSQEVKIEQLGTHQTAQLKPGQSATLLKISVPESLVARAGKAFADPNATPLIPDVFECRLEFKP